jgi:hypothetical protein
MVLVYGRIPHIWYVGGKKLAVVILSQPVLIHVPRTLIEVRKLP